MLNEKNILVRLEMSNLDKSGTKTKLGSTKTLTQRVKITDEGRSTKNNYDKLFVKTRKDGHIYGKLSKKNTLGRNNFQFCFLDIASIILRYHSSLNTFVLLFMPKIVSLGNRKHV